MCETTYSSTSESRNRAAIAAAELASEMSRYLNVNVSAISLQLWLDRRWSVVSSLAHKIHDGATNG